MSFKLSVDLSDYNSCFLIHLLIVLLIQMIQKHAPVDKHELTLMLPLLSTTNTMSKSAAHCADTCCDVTHRSRATAAIWIMIDSVF